MGRQWVVGLLLLMGASGAGAQDRMYNSDVLLEDESRLTVLSRHRQWHHLLHYRYHPFSGQWKSQPESERFFLAQDGKSSPLSELKANVVAFLRVGQPDNASAQCRFPARYHWVKSQWPEQRWQDQDCSELDAWSDKLAAHSVTVIFPASHINSPSSMYGHTLIRLDRKDPESSKLLAFSVNFAANADPTDNELVFSYKGLAGGYPGVVSIMPYHVKTREYQHMEYRDVWEYSLNLTQGEVAQFVRHVWELQDIEFDYFFFDENCAYRILAMLDAASERADMAGAFDYKAVPVDTIRAMYGSGLVASDVFRPSAATQMLAMMENASEQVQLLAKRLVESDEHIDELLHGVDPHDQAFALEIAHHYARYLSVKKKRATSELRQRNLALLSARSKLHDVSVPLESVNVEPPVRDDQGHLSQRVTLSGGIQPGQGEHAFARLGLRPAFHDVMDLPEGFKTGSQIAMGNTEVQWQRGQGVQLDRLVLVDVLSLSPRGPLIRPLSWGVSAGVDRWLADDREIFSYLKVLAGYTCDLGFNKAEAGQWFVMSDTELQADNQFDDGVRLGSGVTMGWMRQKSNLQWWTSASWKPGLAGDHRLHRNLAVNVGYRLGPNRQMRLNWDWQALNQEIVREWRWSVGWYF